MKSADTQLYFIESGKAQGGILRECSEDNRRAFMGFRQVVVKVE